MTTIHADELRPGDVVAYGGHDHVITHVERAPNWSWSIAGDGTGWAIALGDQLVDVRRRTGRAGRTRRARRRQSDQLHG